MAIITIPQVKWGKRKTRSQMCEVFTEDGRIVQPEMDVLRSCVDDGGLGMGFLLDASNQFRGTDGQWYQVLWERSCFPVAMIKPGKNADFRTLTKAIYKEHKEMAIAEQYKIAKQDAMGKFFWIISVVCATFIVIATISYFKG